MRIIWKLSLIVALGVVLQQMLTVSVADLDDAQFTARVWSNTLCGHPTDTELAAAADRLRDRDYARHFRDPAWVPIPAPPPHVSCIQSDDDPA